MKLTLLLETLRTDVLELQQKLIDALDDEFDVSIKNGSSHSRSDGRDAYSIQVRHPLLKQPVTASILADGPRGPEVKVGSFMQFDLSHPSGLEGEGGLLEYINARVDYVKILKWLTANGFEEITKDALERQERVRLLGSGFIKSSRLFSKRLGDLTTLAFKLGFDSYQNVQHEYWIITIEGRRHPYASTSTHSLTQALGDVRSHRIKTFDEVEHLLGSIIN